VKLLGHFLGLAPVLARVVEFPDVVVERRGLLADEDSRRLVPCHGGPAFVIDASVPEYWVSCRSPALASLKE
jgi:hypothetical protein